MIPYVHAMYDALLQAKAFKIAVLGCAAGTLGTMLANAHCQVTVVDINPYTFDLARRYFQLSPEVICIQDDARHFLETTSDTFDGIAMDVFDQGKIPFHLRTVEFFRAAAGRLHPGGAMVVNTIIEHDLDLMGDNVAASMQAGLQMPVMLLDDPQAHDRNAGVVAGIEPLPVFPYRHEPPAIQQALAKMALRPARRQASAFYDHTIV
jgi:predicted O-methyltransferase YrrM